VISLKKEKCADIGHMKELSLAVALISETKQWSYGQRKHGLKSVCKICSYPLVSRKLKQHL